MKRQDLTQLDKRVVQKNIESGVVKKDDFEKYIKSLPDEKENSEQVPFEEDELFPIAEKDKDPH